MRIALRLSFLSLVSILLTSCLTYKEVTYSGVKDVEIVRMSMTGIKLKVTVGVNNPNSYKIKLKSGTFNISSEGFKLGSFELAEKVVIPKESEGDVVAIVETKIENLLSPKLISLMNKIRQNKIPITVEGEVKAKAMLFTKKVKFNETQTISL